MEGSPCSVSRMEKTMGLGQRKSTRDENKAMRREKVRGASPPHHHHYYKKNSIRSTKRKRYKNSIKIFHIRSIAQATVFFARSTSVGLEL